MARPGFKGASDGGVAVRLPAWLRKLLGEQFGELDSLLATEAPAEPVDPLEALTGLSAGPVQAPTDPVLRRLRPDGYAESVDDGAAAAEFRRFTALDLEALQRERVAVVRETLAGGDRFTLDAEQAQAWLGALNDLRLAIGTRIGVTDDLERPAPDDPRAAAFDLYGWLTSLQGDLLVALGAPDL